ncbi:alanine/glycine:cation symporter family protein [Serratia rhizosphaerae]|uniref:alanine/glycine:cation symporter family protein n=1 Tax=unclassified Serratia (in: enterobacteria) TaxID=2647522 RepID=UPI000CF67014|nr:MULTISPECIES: sodium:alanine symporter family protein [unclassified Serratia (in: enterobacteria)]MBU3895202.1 sodium:alanine symporter family protein [Serratia rubidaea]AVJ19154.1 sodium:alanine symporter family protein [Serratia sp. MYb239]QNK33318.1 sodium:alanine symporter family protein [Serratia sp. JUb9]CAE1149844.1 Sodium/alanine symporter AgcS [Serratia sp. Tan611]SQJ09134.1 Na+/alanine symporter [Serratia rubidaea]
MDWVIAGLSAVNGVVWGVPMLIGILGIGIFLQIRLSFLPIRRLGTGFKLLFERNHDRGDGQISPFNALMTALSATIGTGNIAGVATAVVLGGPGALFWMWITALVGMATKYSEAVLAVRFREVDDRGHYVGGPMYYIKHGLGKKWMWLGTLFAFFGSIAGFGIGNTVQANSIAEALNSNFGISHGMTAGVLVVLVGAVLIGGIKRIADVAGKLVPLMTVGYFAAGIIVLGLNVSEIPAAFSLIITSAFTPVAAQGGFAGAAVWAAIRFGVARGVFSNEAGLGSAPIAHAAAKTQNPIRQGLIAMLGTFIDTIIVCSITGLTIIISGKWISGETGAALTSTAFSSSLPGGNYIVAVALAIFAFTTILGWSFYGEKCIQYLFGPKMIVPFRIAWIIALPIGATQSLEFVWLLADTLNAMMAIPNLIALALLSPVVYRLTRAHINDVNAPSVQADSTNP